MKCTIAMMFALYGLAGSAHGALLGHWKFNEASGATTAADSATPGTNGVVGTGVTTGLVGKEGNAYQFPGGTNADDAAPNPEIVDMDNALTVVPQIIAADKITISAWFNWANNPAARGAAVTIATNVNPTTTAGNQNFIQLGVTDSVGGFNTEGGIFGGINIAGATTEVVNTTGSNPAPGGTNVVPSEVPVGGGTALNDGLWHHAVMTINSATEVMKLYVDGVDVGTGRPALSAPGTPAVIADFPTILNNVEVGRLGRSAECCSYIGLVDDVQIYDEVLSAAQVSYLFNNPGTTVPEPASLALLGLGLGGLVLLGRQRRT